jgi:hypothetical protein
VALHPHGSALLSVHPKVPAGEDQSVIAACTCSVEQATDGMRFADAGDVGKENHRAWGHSFPAGMERLDIVRGTVAVGEWAFGTSSQRRVSANLLAAAHRHRRNPKHKFCVALIRCK